MRIVFVRHGEKRSQGVDPELTTAGKGMADETGAWLARRLIVPDKVVITPTRRTRQTLEALNHHLPPAPVSERADLPETLVDWEIFTHRISLALNATGTLLIVGHHPTQHFLLDAFGPPPVDVPRHHFATALLLDTSTEKSWIFADVWPGRAN